MSAPTHLKFTTKRASETKRLGQRIGRFLKAGDVVALVGELGAGKTTLVKGIAKGLGVASEEEILSPSFVLIHEYDGREKIYHIDWYRLGSVDGPDRMLALECFHADAVTLVEWADRGSDILPKEHLQVEIKHQGGNKRQVKISGKFLLRTKRI